MKKYFVYTIAILSLSIGIFSIGALRVSAQQGNAPEGGQALEIGPPLMNLSADPGQTVTANISLRDISKGKLVVTSQINDFIAAGEDGVPKLIIDEKDGFSPYSLKEWVSPFPRMTLDPQQVKTLPLTIKVPANAAPGGYYGVVRFTGVPPELEDTGVSLSASLGTLIFLTVKGEAKEGMEIAEFFTGQNGKPSSLFESAPVAFTARLKNTGNVHQQPSVDIIIKDMFGNNVTDVALNNPARNILPASIRKFSKELDSKAFGDRILFGKYTANISVFYGSQNIEVKDSIDFWIIPWRIIGIIVAILILGFFILRFALKSYTKRAIRKAQGGNHRHRRR